MDMIQESEEHEDNKKEKKEKKEDDNKDKEPKPKVLVRSLSVSSQRQGLAGLSSPVKLRSNNTFTRQSQPQSPAVNIKDDKQSILATQANILAAVSESRNLVNQQNQHTLDSANQMFKAKSYHPLAKPIHDHNSSLQKELSEANAKIKQLQDEASKAKAKIETLQRTIENYNERKGDVVDEEQLKLDNIRLTAERDNALEQVEELTHTKKILDDEIDSLHEELTAALDELKSGREKQASQTSTNPSLQDIEKLTV
jgi:chromosome segregation ATPase